MIKLIIKNKLNGYVQHKKDYMMPKIYNLEN